MYTIGSLRRFIYCRDEIERDRTYARYVVVAAHPFGQQPIPDLPREDGRTLALVVGDLVHHTVGGHPRLRAANGTWLDRTGFIVSVNKTDTIITLRGIARVRRVLFVDKNITIMTSRINRCAHF